MSAPEIRFKGFADPWEQRKLGEVAEIIGGGTPDTNNPNYWDGDIDWYSPAELGEQIYADASQRRITREGYENSSAKMLPADKTILFTSRAGIGTTAILRRSACTNQGFQSLALRDEVNVYFIYSMSDRIKAYAESKASGSTFLEISGRQLAEMDLMLPNRAEQDAIGSFFAQLDNLITLHQSKHDKLTTLKKSMLDKMFPKEGADIPEIRFAGFADPWEQRKLDELATFGGGHTPSMADESNYADGEILWVTSQDVKVDYLSDTTTKLSEKGASELKLYPAGTLLMVTRSGILRHTLPVSMLRKPSTVNQDIRTISTNKDCSSLWLMQHLKARSKELLLEYGKTGTTVESIDFAKMKSMTFMLPTPSEQKAIGELFQQLDNLITLHQRKLKLLKHIKSSLLNRCFV